MTWDAKVATWRLSMELTCGNRRCRVRLVEADAPRGEVITVEVMDDSASEAARKALLLVTEHLVRLEREASR